MKTPALQNELVGVLRMAFQARKVLGTFEKRATEEAKAHYKAKDPYNLLLRQDVCNWKSITKTKG